MSLLLFATAQGMLKQVEGVEFDVSKRTIAATKLQESDAVISVALLRDVQQLVLQTEEGYFLRFPISEIPMKKKGALGVRGIRLGSKDKLVGIHCLDGRSDAIVKWKEKEIHLNKLRIARRDTKGIKARI